MRSFLASGLLITLCASASASTMHHSRTHHAVFNPPGAASSFDAVPGLPEAPWPAIRYDDVPSYNDHWDPWGHWGAYYGPMTGAL